MTGGHYSGLRLRPGCARRDLVADSPLELFLQRFERGPARVGGELLVRMRLLVQVLAADRAEARAVGAVQDLLRQLERERVARPGGEVERVIRDVRRFELLVARRIVRLILGRPDRQLEHRVAQAAEARAVEPHPELEVVQVAWTLPS